MNVNEKDWSVSMAIERSPCVVEATVCGMSSSLVHVTLVPAFTFNSCGLKTKFPILTCTSSESDGAAETAMRERRLNPWYGHRRSILNQLSPSLLTKAQRSESLWEHIDGWGWLPGRTGATAEQIEKGITSTAGYYVPLFASYEVSPVADRALRQLVAECRENDIPVALLYLPEGAVFRSFMTPESVRLSDEHLRQVVGERVVDRGLDVAVEAQDPLAILVVRAQVDVVVQHLLVPVREGALVAEMLEHGFTARPAVLAGAADAPRRDRPHQLRALGGAHRRRLPAAQER